MAGSFRLSLQLEYQLLELQRVVSALWDVARRPARQPGLWDACSLCDFSLGQPTLGEFPDEVGR